jgi:predicted PurR-regulated permease PerM
VRKTMPLDEKRRDRLLKRTGERLEAIILGTILVSLVQGIAAALGWWVLGFPAPVFWGFVMTVLAIIPFFGPFMVLIPAGVIWILLGETFAGVALIVWALVLVGLIDDVLRPYVIGRRSKVHAGVILVGILGGIHVFGISGFVLGPLLLGLLAPVLAEWARPEDEPLRERGGEAGEEAGDVNADASQGEEDSP